MRPYKTDYAGTWCGYCKTRESAIRAAVKHILEDGYAACSITENGRDIASVKRQGNSGVHIEVFNKPLIRVRRAP